MNLLIILLLIWLLVTTSSPPKHFLRNSSSPEVFTRRKLPSCSGDYHELINEANGFRSRQITCESDKFTYTWNDDPGGIPYEPAYFYFSIKSIQMYAASCKLTEGANVRYSSGACRDASPPPPFSFVYNGQNELVLSCYAEESTGFNDDNFPMNEIEFNWLLVPSSDSDATSSNMNIDWTIRSGTGTSSPFLVESAVPADITWTWRIDKTEKYVSAGRVSNEDPLVLSLANLRDICNVDLKIYDGINTAGTKLYDSVENCADPPLTWLLANSRQATIIATTDSSSSDIFFEVLWGGVDEKLYGCGHYDDPDELPALSHIMDDGSSSLEPMKTGQDLPDGCRWRITPDLSDTFDVESTITLFVTRSTLKVSSFVRVYDGSSASSSILWRSDRVDSEVTLRDRDIVPPPLISTRGTLYVYYSTANSAASAGEVGWAAEYQTDFTGSQGMGGGQSYLASSTALYIRPPGDGTTYTRDFKYRYVVEPASIVDGGITFVFSSMNLKDCDDHVTIYDGTVETPSAKIATFCGSDTPRTWYTTTKNSSLVVFETGDDDKNNGTFEMSYFSNGPDYNCGFPSGKPAVLKHATMMLSDSSSDAEDIFELEDCEWVIEPPSLESVYIFFERFDLKGAELFIWTEDVDTGELELLSRNYDSEDVPPSIHVSGKNIRVRYNSSRSASGMGFALSYFASWANETGPGSGPILQRASLTYKLPFPILSTGGLPRGKRLEWLIAPSSPSAYGRLYFFFSNISRPDVDCSHSNLTIYSGEGIDEDKKIGTFCADTPPETWVMTEQTADERPAAYLVVETDGSDNGTSIAQDFEFGYFNANGSNTQCGIVLNPAILRSGSGILTDGSGSSSHRNMSAGLHCEWSVQPYEAENDEDAVIQLEFIDVDLAGATIEVWDTRHVDSRGDDSLLWRCRGCKLRPLSLFSTTGELFVTLRTTNDTSISRGMGFTAVYSTAKSASWFTQSEELVLEQPSSLDLDITEDDSLLAWHVPVSDSLGSLKMYPKYYTYDTEERRIVDGRPRNITVNDDDNGDGGAIVGIPDPDIFAAHDVAYSCGHFASLRPARLRTDEFNPDINFKATHRYDAFMSRHVEAAGHRRSVSRLSSTHQSGYVDARDEVVSASKCKYVFSSGSFQAFTLGIEAFSGIPGDSTTPRLQVYNGLDGMDNLAFDSHEATKKKKKDDEGVKKRTVKNDAPTQVTAHCGRAVVVLDASEASSAPTMRLSFKLVSGDPGGGQGVDKNSECHLYWKSLQPKEPEPDYLTPILIAAGAILSIIGIAYAILYIRKHWNDPPKSSKKKYTIVYPHPPYTRILDDLRNKFLRRGTCVICRDEPVPVFRLPCSHKVCYTCLRGYLEAALGDISMFPVKCPMHYEGCGGEIGPFIAKRVLAKSQYNRFLDFQDRAVYGDGMRCIFCNNYVNFPLQESAITMVECPYCIQKFCIRCKKPWHYGGKCPLEDVDDGLKMWKNNSGASACPACRKIIEKDDPDTCHHMVHKVTDSIPCIRERTDFCYQCGTEVAGDYPHVEIDNPSVNHFPDGVFQNCRKHAKKLRDMERDRIRKERRRKPTTRITVNSGSPGNIGSPSRVAPGTAELDAGVWSEDMTNDFGGTGDVWEAAQIAPQISHTQSAVDRLWESSISSPLDGSPASTHSSPDIRHASPHRSSPLVSGGHRKRFNSSDFN